MAKQEQHFIEKSGKKRNQEKWDRKRRKKKPKKGKKR